MRGDRFRPDLVRGTLVLLGLCLCAVAGLAQGPSRVMVADVIVQGNQHVPSQNITARLATKPGTEFQEYVVQQDVRNLMGTRQFAHVDPRIERLGDGRVNVYFLIRDYPNTVRKVEYRGAKQFGPDELGKATNVVVGQPLNPVANKVACQAVVRRYQEAGRLFATCDLAKGDKSGDTEVVFNITEGPIVKIAGFDVEFEGENTFVSKTVLLQHIDSWRAVLGVGGAYNPMAVENDTLKLEEYYKGNGYLEARVTRELRWTADARQVTVVFHVRMGRRYTVAGTPTVACKSLPPEQLERLSLLKTGDFFNQSAVDKDKRVIEDYVGWLGREARVQVNPALVVDSPGVVRVNYEVVERPPARVGQVFIVGNDRTRQNVILRQVPLFPGQVLTYPALREAERNLTRLNIFDVSPDGAIRPTVTVLDPEIESEFKDILVTVKEANTGSLLFGVGVNSDAGLNGSIVLHERNFDITRFPTSIEDAFSGNAFRGGGQELRIEAVPGTQLQRYSITVREPFLFDSPYSFGVSGYYYTRAFDEYTERRIGSRLTLGRKIDQFWSLTGSARLENVDVDDVSAFAPPQISDYAGSNLQIGLAARAVRDTRDSFLRPTEGSILDFGYEQMFGDYTFPVLSADFSKYFTVWQRADGSGRHVLAARSFLGWAGDDTPVYERFYAGGFRSIRGFAFRGVGPDVNGFKVGGNFELLTSLEYQVPLMANDQVYAVAFCDGGTVTPRIDDFDNYRVSAGFGFRFAIPVFGQVPIALDFGFPIVKARSDNQQVLNFSLGFYR